MMNSCIIDYQSDRVIKHFLLVLCSSLLSDIDGFVLLTETWTTMSHSNKTWGLLTNRPNCIFKNEPVDLF